MLPGDGRYCLTSFDSPIFWQNSPNKISPELDVNVSLLDFSENDGIKIKIRRLMLDEKADRHFVAFEPTQIKLADGTNTDFDSNNPDIRFGDGGKLN